MRYEFDAFHHEDKTYLDYVNAKKLLSKLETEIEGFKHKIIYHPLNPDKINIILFCTHREISRYYKKLYIIY